MIQWKFFRGLSWDLAQSAFLSDTWRSLIGDGVHLCRVWRWHKIGKASQWARRQRHHPEAPRWVGGIVQQEPHEFNKCKMLSPALGWTSLCIGTGWRLPDQGPIGRGAAENDLGILMGSGLKTSHQCGRGNGRGLRLPGLCQQVHRQ